MIILLSALATTTRSTSAHVAAALRWPLIAHFGHCFYCPPGAAIGQPL